MLHFSIALRDWAFHQRSLLEVFKKCGLAWCLLLVLRHFYDISGGETKVSDVWQFYRHSLHGETELVAHIRKLSAIII